MNLFHRPFFLLCVSVLVVCGCSKEHDSGDGHNHADGVGHASEAAVPGSHEDWCGEHQVPESKCTRCDPALAAAFKATGDWCNLHGLPESQCLKCHPELEIVRPPASGDK